MVEEMCQLLETKSFQTMIDLRDWGLDVRAQSSTAAAEMGEAAEPREDVVSLFVLLTLLSNKPPVLCP